MKRSFRCIYEMRKTHDAGARGHSAGARHGALVDVFDGEAAPQHLDENLPELPGGQVVEQRVDDGAEVEEGVGHRVENDVAPEVEASPTGLRNGSHHEATDLVGKPAQQRSRQRTLPEKEI
uniref:Uncharacterized protein n=1 Tax=Mola mola TaxID=94237 RepID=A0A3Q3XMB5_MOLML